MEVAKILVNKIKRDNRQPRQQFNDESLEHLADSMQQVGQLQPVIVKRQGPDYLLVAGERRLRAVKKNQEKEIAAVILDEGVKDATIRQIQLIENLQREDLNPLDRARSIQRFIEENGLTKKEASEKLGVPRTTLTEWLNILEVEDKYQQAVVDEDSPLSLSHISLAKALASRTGDPTKLNQLLDGVLKYNLSRSETKEVTEIFNRYLHISMEEAIGAILLKRERSKLLDTGDKRSKSQENDPVKRLINSFTNTSKKLEEVMEEVGCLKEEEREYLKDEFLYIYQLIEIMIPEFRKKNIYEMINQIKEKNTG
ncbi:MAG: ParB family transcriptional regulator, chromosome partitioning protein [Halanaerobiales bacterium]|nr:ParB family transcriptional regulator, chromosome partitioning protein [Halanaerobiales bacterium]